MNFLNNKVLFVLTLVLISLISFSTVNAHGADITEDAMVIANGSNGVIAKSIIDDNNLSYIKVYNFKSEGDVEHQLEHALSNPNKKILVIAYQDIANKFLNNHSDVKNKIIVVDGDNSSIENGLNQLNSIYSNDSTQDNFVTPLIVGLIVGLVIGIVVGVAIIKIKSK